MTEPRCIHPQTCPQDQCRVDEITVALKACGHLFHHLRPDLLALAILQTFICCSGSRRAVLILLTDQIPEIILEIDTGQFIHHDPTTPLESVKNLPVAALHHAIRNAIPLRTGQKEPGLMPTGLAAGLCLPLIHQDTLEGFLYLEDETAQPPFHKAPPGLPELMALQTALAISHVRLRSMLEKEAQARQQAENRANRACADLSLFSRISAHHLQEPTRHLLIYSRRLDQLMREDMDHQEALLSLKFIHDGATRMRNLVRDIERYLAAAETRGLMIQQNTRAVMEMALYKLNRRLQQTGAIIEVQSLPTVYLDQPRLVEIFEILLENALIYRLQDEPPRIRVSGERISNVTRIVIADNGPGIAETYRLKVFDVFERLHKNPEAGTGIGLAIVRRIVESRQGKITIETADIGGAAIVFELPDESPSP